MGFGQGRSVMRSIFQMVTAAVLLGFSCHAGEAVIEDEQGMSCYVYTPDVIQPDMTYQLVVGVHGAGSGGKGAAGMASWAQRGDVIVIGPSFQTKGERPYQNGDGPHAAKLIALFKQLGSQYKLHDKMFLHGFSGGSQFSHRFAMLHPELVCGVSAHSGGSWATDGYGVIRADAKSIPFAISCGEKDTGKAWGAAKYTRLDWYQRFRDEIDELGFCHAASSWPDVGHRISPGAWALARECFQLATGLPGNSASERVEISERWKHLDQLPKRKAAPLRGANGIAAPDVDPAELAKMTRAAFKMADEQEIPNDKLVNFMSRYPPILWKDKPSAANLLAQCERAALDWRERALGAGRFEGQVLRKFQEFSNGLTLPQPRQAR